ncbi:hypothetical protein [Streptomyces jumonjinensis]|uniref:Uncharacterized protein n=1 Tax=Streptomyces jumonjinensis TaxID=1945 RepID=A0A646KPX8_STRJU|nr:hypothetical protein [Streptomyces jumonjinensis]MQT04117.1 hypothetical protein [Streptomyces jumonjinensis]
MSGPIALGPDVGREDTLSLRLLKDRGVPHDGDDRTLVLRVPDTDATRPGEAGSRPGYDGAVDRLAADLADSIGPAVHPYEVAALLESQGLTAEVIRERYGHPDLFTLATVLYEKIPRTFPEPAAPATDPWRPDHVRCALRGVLFALPGLAYVLIGQVWDPNGGAYALVLAGLISWAWGQALSHRAYLRMATGRREAGRTLLLGAPMGAAVAVAAGVVLTGRGPMALFVAGQSLYLASAGVLLVLGQELVLLAALLPMVVGAAALPWWEPGTPLRIGLPLLSLVGAAAAAGRALRSTLTEQPAAGTGRPGLLRSLPYGLFGLAAGVLVMLEGRHHPYAVVMLSLSMGPAEWLLYRYRGMSAAALRATSTLPAFRRRSAGIITLCLLGYLLPILPATLIIGAEPGPVLLLATTLWTALLLQAFGVAWPPAAVCLAAACGAGALTFLHPSAVPVALVLSCGPAAVVLVICALSVLGRPSAHA